jgi:cyclopropane-fatty-acyl-phospholipid synthase
MLYSCAYFRHGEETIDEAQTNKINLICHKLRLKSGDHLLDIGCGWGSLIIHAAKEYGARCRGITLSQQQYDFINQRIQREGLEGSCWVELKDYRELEGDAVYDKIVSVGMFEHVGIDYFQVYFENVRRLLKNDGMFLNHGITTCRTKVLKSTGSKFMDTFIFPNAELINLGFIIQSMEENGFEVLDVESLRRHYARTLRLWNHALEQQHNQALLLVSEPTYRAWLLYMAGCSYSFEKGQVNIYQVLLAKKGNNTIPMTREDIYEMENLNAGY